MKLTRRNMYTAYETRKSHSKCDKIVFVDIFFLSHIFWLLRFSCLHFTSIGKRSQTLGAIGVLSIYFSQSHMDSFCATFAPNLNRECAFNAFIYPLCYNKCFVVVIFVAVVPSATNLFDYFYSVFYLFIFHGEQSRNREGCAAQNTNEMISISFINDPIYAMIEMIKPLSE